MDKNGDWNFWLKNFPFIRRVFYGFPSLFSCFMYFIRKKNFNLSFVHPILLYIFCKRNPSLLLSLYKNDIFQYKYLMCHFRIIDWNFSFHQCHSAAFLSALDGTLKRGQTLSWMSWMPLQTIWGFHNVLSVDLPSLYIDISISPWIWPWVRSLAFSPDLTSFLSPLNQSNYSLCLLFMWELVFVIFFSSSHDFPWNYPHFLGVNNLIA